MFPASTQEDKDVIAKYPLGRSLSPLREPLRESRASTSREPHVDDANVPFIISRLLLALMSHDAAFYMKARTDQGSVASELARLFANVQTIYDNELFGPLVQAVIDTRSDDAVWEAVLVLIESSLRPASAQSIPTSIASLESAYTVTSNADSVQTARSSISELPESFDPSTPSASSTPIITPTVSEFPLPPAQSSSHNAMQSRAIADKVFIADVVENNDYFFPFDPSARGADVHRQREAFKQAVLRDLDRLYIRVVNGKNDPTAFREIARRVRALGPQFPLWRFEVATFSVVKDLEIEVADFEVLKGLQVWQSVSMDKKGQTRENREHSQTRRKGS
jgi:hypothetical protein